MTRKFARFIFPTERVSWLGFWVPIAIQKYGVTMHMNGNQTAGCLPCPTLSREPTTLVFTQICQWVSWCSAKYNSLTLPIGWLSWVADELACEQLFELWWYRITESNLLKRIQVFSAGDEWVWFRLFLWTIPMLWMFRGRPVYSCRIFQIQAHWQGDRMEYGWNHITWSEKSPRAPIASDNIKRLGPVD